MLYVTVNLRHHYNATILLTIFLCASCILYEKLLINLTCMLLSEHIECLANSSSMLALHHRVIHSATHKAAVHSQSEVRKPSCCRCLLIWYNYTCTYCNNCHLFESIASLVRETCCGFCGRGIVTSFPKHFTTRSFPKHFTTRLLKFHVGKELSSIDTIIYFLIQSQMVKL